MQQDNRKVVIFFMTGKAGEKPMLTGKSIVLGVTGGIAAYKAVSLCSALVQRGAEVKVIMTESAEKFVTPLTFQVISRNAVFTDTFKENDPSVIAHIDLADHADLIVVAPATANVIAKMAHGLADDMLTTTLLAATAPILVAPAMNVHMYNHPAVQQNMDILRNRGVLFVPPGTGQLACGYVGEGRLAEPEDILRRIEEILFQNRALAGRKVLVTAGGTVERLDPVRYISNDSSGKMGYAIAKAAEEMGAQVTLISAPTSLAPPPGVKLIKAVSAQDMYEAVMEHMSDADVIVKAAAVADYRPKVRADQKIKKNSDTILLELEKTPDILKAVGEKKTRQFVVGFAAETNDVEKYAREKLTSKNCDLIVANDVTLPGAGFGGDTNKVAIYDRSGLVESLSLMSKKQVARRLLTLIAERLPDRSGKTDRPGREHG
jgi:phosphopantothenoylcysteine decarboxylase/phosphopantothenate--cysteine ligase